MKKTIQMIIFIIVLGIQVIPVFASNKTLDQYILVLQNENFNLYYNEATAEVALEDIEASKVWYTNPQEVEENEKIIDFNKSKLQSQLIIEIVNQNNIVETALSFVEAVKKEKVTYIVEDNKLIVTYQFDKFSIQIPLVYELTPNGLKAYVESSQIKEGDTHRLTKIAITPYFGAAKEGTKGYILLPDGCGAIMEFDQYKNSNIYGSKVYGRDISLTNDTAPNKDERIMLPVFGMKIENEGIFGIITQGEEYASVVAQQALPTLGYNYVYANFETRVLNYYYLEEKDPGRTRQVPYISESLRPNDVYCIEYNILRDEESDYMGMAKFYQQYLVEHNLLPNPKDETKKLLNIDVYGGVNVDSVVLGIPVTKFISLTTFKQCQYMIQELLDEGANALSIRYRGWEKDGLMREGAHNNTVPASKLGGKKDMETLENRLEVNGVPIYFEHDLITYRPRDLSFLDLRKTIRNVGNYYAYQYSYNLPTKDIDRSVARTLLISPTELEKRVPKMLADFGSHVAIKDIANLVYHDSHKINGSIKNTVNTFTEQLAKIAEDRGVLLESPNVYGLKYADLIVNAPVYSSDYMNFTRDVPFYQMVLQGYVDYFTPYVNRNANPREMVLKAIESGSGVSFGGTYEDPTILLDTQYNNLMISQYDSWKSMALETYKELEAIHKMTEGSSIVMHDEVEEGVVCVAYANQTKIVINYNKEVIEYNGQKIPAKDYIISN